MMKGNVITELYFSIFPCFHTKNVIIILTVTMRSRLKNMKFKKLIIRIDSAAVALRNSWTAYVKYFVLNMFYY